MGVNEMSGEEKKLTLDECCVAYMLYYSFESDTWAPGELKLLRELSKRTDRQYGTATRLFFAMRKFYLGGN